MGWPTGAVSPAFTTTPMRTPESNASTSSVAFSVSTCAMTSPALTSSPSFFSHSAIFPSVIWSESFGILIGFAISGPRRGR